MLVRNIEREEMGLEKAGVPHPVSGLLTGWTKELWLLLAGCYSSLNQDRWACRRTSKSQSTLIARTTGIFNKEKRLCRVWQLSCAASSHRLCQGFVEKLKGRAKNKQLSSLLWRADLSWAILLPVRSVTPALWMLEKIWGPLLPVPVWRNPYLNFALKWQ